MNNREDSEVSITSASKSSRLFVLELMRQLTHFGKRVMAGVLLVIASTLMIAAAIVVLEDWAYKIHVSQDAFNVLFVFGLAIYSKILVDMVCIIKHGELRDEI